MRDIAIEVSELGKKYSLGQMQSYKTLRDAITNVFTAPADKLKKPAGDAPAAELRRPDFWALRDASFEIERGEVVGFIGRNGAGKSTLLKILSRITEPTEGKANMYGRCGTLLEVGTGFHPELTGRENVYLNGAIIGMKRADINRHFGEIVEFSGVEKFLDTPVKRYSSGMQVRLAFAVAAHLDPEIMIVDEVLAVGDAEFQAKCMGKMGEIASQGRTVLFVSHNMAAVSRLCTRAVLLDAGRIIDDGPVDEVSSRYLQSDTGTTAERRWMDVQAAPQSDDVRLIGVRILTEDGLTTDTVDVRDRVGMEIEYEVKRPAILSPNFHMFDGQGEYVFVVSDSYDCDWGHRPRSVGRWKSRCWIPANFLSEGTYVVGAAISTLDPVFVHFYERDAIAFQVIERAGGITARGTYIGPMPGAIRPMLDWTSEHIE